MIKKSGSLIKSINPRSSRVTEQENESDENKDSEMKNILKRRELDLPVAQMG